MEIEVTLTQSEFKKLIAKFAYRHIIDHRKCNIAEHECTVIVEPFLQLINHKSKTIRKLSIKVLAEARHKNAVRLLIAALDDKRSSVKDFAAYYLGQLRDRTALKPLLLAVNDVAVDATAMIAIRDLLREDLESEMVKALSDPDSKIRNGAGWVLANFLFVSQSTSALIKALKAKNYKLRYAATTALGRGDSICACKALIESSKIPTRRLSIWEARINAIKLLKTKLEDALQEIVEYSKTQPSMQQTP